MLAEIGMCEIGDTWQSRVWFCSLKEVARIALAPSQIRSLALN
jgi:hypothetical protein